MKENINVNEFISNRKRPENTVHFGKLERFQEAKKQLGKNPIERLQIIKWTNEFIKSYGLKIYNGNNEEKIKNVSLNELNNTMARFEGLTDEKDIIWMKFTESNHLGVVACSNDINFDIPNEIKDYDEPSKVINGIIKGWKYQTSGIIVHSVGQKWDTNSILVFPLIALCNGAKGKKQRHNIETGIGNYLISKDVPILDFYSHRI